MSTYKPWQLRMIRESRCICCGSRDLAETGKVKKRKTLRCVRCTEKMNAARK